jgi:hypothetical protein
MNNNHLAHIRNEQIKEVLIVARGKHFNHKEKGHEPTIPKHGHEVAGKETERVGYDIETVGTESERPVSIKIEE